MKKYKIGYTTGVYDMFHVGHLNILKKAKEQCDFLIVGVSTDQVVKDYKGKTPIIPFEDRIEIVKSIKYVDKAVPQTNIDKYDAWLKYKYDVIFHGDDWKHSELYKSIEKRLKNEGVEFVYFPYTKNVSSSILAKKVNNN